jgi:hypothetical protein
LIVVVPEVFFDVFTVVVLIEEFLEINEEAWDLFVVD